MSVIFSLDFLFLKVEYVKLSPYIRALLLSYATKVGLDSNLILDALKNSDEAFVAT